MSAWLVDTDGLIQVLHGNADATQTLERLAVDGLAVSVIAFGELYQGAYYSRDRAKSLERLEALLAGFDMLPLTRDVMVRFGIVRGLLTRNQRQQVGDMDLLIAATALEHNLTLLTFNIRDYGLVPGLMLFQP